MQWKMRFIVISIWLLLAPSTGWSEVVDWIVAVVNDDVILNSELQEKVDMLRKVSPEAEALSEDELRRTAIQGMIWDRLAQQEVKKYKVTAKESDIDMAIEDIKKENGYTDEQLKQALSQQGKTLEDFRKQIKAEMERSRLIQRVLKSKTVVTDEQIDAHLQGGGTAPKVASPPVVERRRLAVLLIAYSSEEESEEAEKKAREIHQRLKKGEDFSALVKRYSDGPALEEGGDIGFVASHELSDEIEEATQGLDPGGVSEVVKTQGSYSIFKILDIEKKDAGSASEVPAGNTEREAIRSMLYKQEVNRKYEEWFKELESRSFIKIHLEPPT
jgi:peptidyl-prolyl cis-trans isomerase SurA